MKHADTVITVCAGTTCYVMGGAELLDELEGAVESGELHATLRGATCFGNCKTAGGGRPPYVSVNGTVIEAATVEKIRETLRAPEAGSTGMQRKEVG
jgi:NADH:ubiquinone oxidoreductase subunit E